MQPALNNGQTREVVLVEALSVQRQSLERYSHHDITWHHTPPPLHTYTGMTLWLLSNPTIPAPSSARDCRLWYVIYHFWPLSHLLISQEGDRVSSVGGRRKSKLVRIIMILCNIKVLYYNYCCTGPHRACLVARWQQEDILWLEALW